jgi:mRNA-degrading endonuclease RelE of RelBE toxin-antitoxin system
MIEILRLPIFEKKLKHYEKKNTLMKKDYQALLDNIQENPENAKFIKDDTYKIRVKNSSSNKGKSAGYRVYYFHKNSKNSVVLLYMYSKNELANLDDKTLDKLIILAKTLFE